MPEAPRDDTPKRCMKAIGDLEDLFDAEKALAERKRDASMYGSACWNYWQAYADGVSASLRISHLIYERIDGEGADEV